jgi:hypothetical protein
MMALWIVGLANLVGLVALYLHANHLAARVARLEQFAADVLTTLVPTEDICNACGCVIQPEDVHGMTGCTVRLPDGTLTQFDHRSH